MIIERLNMKNGRKGTAVSYNSSRKIFQKFGDNRKKKLIFASTRTRQASLQCLNRRVVLFYNYGTTIPQTIFYPQ